MVTIYDIAKRTGFSPPTVSKALNDQTDISESTKQHIIAIATEMGYVPNQHAKTLVTKKAWLVGVIYEEHELHVGMEHPLFIGILNAFKARIEAEGYDILFIAKNLGGRKMTYLEHCRYRSVDAVLILNGIDEDNEIQEVVQSDILCVSSNLIFPNAVSVSCENFESSALAVKYLHDLGHRRIAHIAGPMHAFALAGEERMEGYKEGLRRAGLPFRSDYIVHTRSWNGESGYEAMLSLWEADEKPSAVYVSGDLLSMGVLRACADLKLKLPEQLSIVSFDDNEPARYMHPALTTFRQDRSAIGHLSAELMLDKLRGKPVQLRVSIPVQLIERESCVPPPAY